jgi:NAD(P)-dependent dehydrogenase (short-subunit alcohol dehydrogenase family)
MVNSKRFSGKFGIVTGAGSGIGRAAALNLIQAGAGLSLTDIDENSLRALSGEVAASDAPKPLIQKTDVSAEAEVQSLVDKTMAHFGRIDFLVTSAGILRRTKFVEMPIPEWDLMMAVNLRGPFLCCRAVVPIMMKQGAGVIVNVASLAGRTASVLGGAHYTSAKHGVVGLTRHIARELGPANIRVNAFCPGATLTPMVQRATPPEELERIAGGMPIRRWSKPEEQARVIAFLLSEDSNFITGACIDSNGGAVMV